MSQAPQISISILGSDFGHLNVDIQKYLNAGVDMLHLDIFDGNFVPTITFGTCVIKGIRKQYPDTFLDCHLCVEYPMKWIHDLQPLNVNQMSVHFEAFSNRQDRIHALKKIRDQGSKAGFVFNPDTPIDVIDSYVDYLDYILIMCVKPGYGGLTLNPRNLLKVQYIKYKFPKIRVGVDGGVKTHNAWMCIESGADVLVVGSAITGAKPSEYANIVETFRKQKHVRYIHDWRGLPSKHTPEIKLSISTAKDIATNADLVDYDEILQLKNELKKVERGDKFILSIGDCSEDIDRYDISKFIHNLNAMYLNLAKVLKRKKINALPIFRACGQIIKPRTVPFEESGENSFWGLNLNTPTKRQFNMQRLVKGAKFAKNAYHVLKKLNANAYIAHEALLVPLEHCMTCKTASGRYFNSSAHLIWLGNKTKQDGHQQMEYLKHMDNPIGIKINAKDVTSPETVLAMMQKLNPYNENGKIVLISRIGCTLETDILKSFYDFLIAHKVNFSWCVDPMHGNTSTYTDHKKVRYLEDIQNEIERTQQALKINGLMFEATPDLVQECLNRGVVTTERRFESLCDPRMNEKQLTQLLGNVTIQRNEHMCLILAKQGSKGLPGKNKLKFRGEKYPFYLQTIFEAKNSGVFDRIFISTNDAEIMHVCRAYDYINVIERSNVLARNDKYVKSVKHAIKEIQKNYNPTTITIPMVVQPFKESNIYRKLLHTLRDQVCDSVVTVSKGPGCREWLLRSYLKHNDDEEAGVYSLKPFVFIGSQARRQDIFEIDNAITCFRVNNMPGNLPWDYLGSHIVGVKQTFPNANFNCDINYKDDLLWGEFLRTYQQWQKEFHKKQIQNYESGLFSDLLDTWGFKNQVVTGLRYNKPKCKYLGKIRTLVLEDREHIEDYKGENIRLGLRFFESLKHDEVLVVKGSHQYAYFGRLMSTLGMKQNIEGVLIDGLTRDTAFTCSDQNTLPIHAKGYSPKDIKERGAVVQVDQKFTIDDVLIHPYDYAFGDNDGVVIIPAKVFENLAFQKQLEKCFHEEICIKNYIGEGHSIKDILSSFKSF